jgi:hypothetical protein
MRDHHETNFHSYIQQSEGQGNPHQHQRNLRDSRGICCERSGAQKKVGFSVGLGQGRTNPQAIRIYHVFVGGTKYTPAANPGSPVMEVLEDIYKNAIKNDD